jgi:hypothetical protein
MATSSACALRAGEGQKARLQKGVRMKSLTRWVMWGALTIVLGGAGRGSAQAPLPSGDPPADAVNPGPELSPYDGMPAADLGACAPAHGGEEDPLPLTLWKFFTEGWGQEFTRRSSEGRAPDLALLRVQTNFMERELRINYAYTNNFHNTKQSNLNNLDYLIAYAFDRRFMVEVVGNEQWIDGRGKNPDEAGPTARFVGRLQLISTADSSYSFNFQVNAPDPSLGQHQTTWSYGLAAFEDLTGLGLYRVGLYYSALFDSLDGPHAAGATLNDVQYDITIAKTLTRPDTPLVGNFTVFLEAFAQTNLDGQLKDRTLVSLTPGIRFNLGKLGWPGFGLDNWVMGGVDIPVSGPHPWDAIYRLTYIKNF